MSIYHNPNCGTSRNVFALIRNSGVEAEVVEYLKTPPGCAVRLRQYWTPCGKHSKVRLAKMMTKVVDSDGKRV